LHVLVVDDDPDARDLFRVVLVYYGAAASAVSTARAALDALQRLHADVVLTDVVLGDSDDGIWLLRQAHSRWPELALIAISGSEVRADVRTNLGFVKYLMKPTQPELLVDAVLVAIAQAARRASAAPQSLALFQPR
jgi:two-component system CheB/CheR fusion protein